MTISKKYDIIIFMKRTLYFWLYFSIAIILAIYFSVRTITTYSGRGPVSHIRNISLTSDSKDKNLSAIRQAISIPAGTTITSINLDEINNRILSIPGVRKSAIRRMPNGKLSIKLSMYQAVALWTDGTQYFPVSADGTIVKTPTDTHNIGNVVFRGQIPNDISEITKQAHKLIGYLDYLEWIEDRRWDMHTLSGITIMLPEDNTSNAINTLITLNNNYKILDKDIKLIDMRDSERVLIK